MIGLYWAFARISFLTQLEYRGQYFMSEAGVFMKFFSYMLLM
jgi:hypothetical protein